MGITAGSSQGLAEIPGAEPEGPCRSGFSRELLIPTCDPREARDWSRSHGKSIHAAGGAQRLTSSTRRFCARPASVPLSATGRSEEHTSELQSLMRISYAVFCLNKKINNNLHHYATMRK